MAKNRRNIRLGFDKKNNHARVCRHGIVRTFGGWINGSRYRLGFGERCNWCKASYAGFRGNDQWPNLCPNCSRFLDELECPKALLAIQCEDYEEIPF